MGFSTFPNNPFPPSSAQFDEGKNEFIRAEIDAIKDGAIIDSFGDVETALALKANTDDVNTALATKTNLSNIAPSFDATSGVYAVGDKVIYNGVLYEFTSAHSTAGEWDESEVQPVKISELIDSLKSGLTNYEFTDSITTHARWVNTSINDLSIYSGRVIYGYMTDASLGRTYTFAMPVSNMPNILTPIWVQRDPSDMSNNDAILVAKEVSTNQLLIYLGSNIPDMTLYLFVH